MPSHSRPALQTKGPRISYRKGCHLLSTQPRCRRRPPYLFKHPDEPLWRDWCSFCFPHSHGVVGARLISPHTGTQTSLFGSSGVLFAFHTTAMASSSSTLPLHTPRRASLARLASSLPVLPLHTTGRASLTRLVLIFLFARRLCCCRLPYLSTHPDEPLWLVWCYFLFSTRHRHPPYLSTHPDEPLWLIWHRCRPL